MKVSVIMPVRNGAKTILGALESIATQTYPDLEIVAIDACSTDGTLEILKSWSKRPLRWISEKDSGTSEALNKGIPLASGELVTFLCSDDFYSHPNVISNAVKFFENDQKLELLYSSLRVIDPNGLVDDKVLVSDVNRLFWSLSTYLLGAFFRKSSLPPNPFDLKLKIANDYDFACRLILEEKLKWSISPDIAMTMRLGGMSNITANDFQGCAEKFRIRRRYFGLLPALPLAAFEYGTSILRSLNFRPYTWGRKMKQSLFKRPS